MIPNISVKGNTYILLVLLLFTIPLPLLTGWLLAVLVHECCHWLAVKLLGGKIYEINIGLGGAVMECAALTEGKNVVCILAGPMGGFIFALLGHWFPRFAICSWVLSAYNLLPLLPLDGGRVLQILWKNPKRFEMFEMMFLMILSAFALYLALFLRFGVFPLCVIFILWMKNRKRPCKEGGCKLQYKQK